MEAFEAEIEFDKSDFRKDEGMKVAHLSTIRPTTRLLGEEE